MGQSQQCHSCGYGGGSEDIGAPETPSGVPSEKEQELVVSDDETDRVSMPVPPAVKHLIACARGTKCRHRDDEHLKAEAHPFDPDYANLCTAGGVEPEEPSLMGLFQWVDSDGTGKLSRQELEVSGPLLSKLFNEEVIITESAWEVLDEDCNGCVNFSEFASWAGPRLGLPLGVKHLFVGKAVDECHGCAVIGCPCEAYVKKCGGAGDVLVRRTSQPDIQDLIEVCVCNHKLAAHNMHGTGDEGEVPYPFYWDKRDTSEGEITDLVPMTEDALQLFQKLFDTTYRSKFTQDRRKHNPSKSQVPARFEVVGALRSENSRIWREYGVKRAQLINDTAVSGGISQYDDILSSMAWSEHGGALADRLKPEINEWYLFHGTSDKAAEHICRNDFKLGYAGRNTGTLDGRGIYFAESITKADEYAVCNDDKIYTVLLTRVVGGHVNYTDEVIPDQEDLVQKCICGPYDSIMGDRRKTRGTYREFVFYDTENFYAEYIIQYKRVYKPSCPA